MKIKIAPSILSADFGRLDEEMQIVAPHCELFHVDVMDGHFVPNITIGPPVVASLKTDRFLDVHLMIENPEKFVEAFVKAGSDRLIVHEEACRHLPSVLKMITEMGCEAAVSIKPGTGVERVKDVLDLVTEVLVMTVEPGFGGQAFMPDMLPKIRQLREMGFEGDIGVDGGINAETARLCVEAGANLLVAGNYIYGSEDRLKAISLLRDLK